MGGSSIPSADLVDQRSDVLDVTCWVTWISCVTVTDVSIGGEGKRGNRRWEGSDLLTGVGRSPIDRHLVDYDNGKDDSWPGICRCRGKLSGDLGEWL